VPRKKIKSSLLRIEKLISTDDKILIFHKFLFFIFWLQKEETQGAAS
jgi:hypothetical protein